MRKKGFLILLLFCAIIAIFSYFTRDRYIEKALEKTMQLIAGAKVEIDGFHYSVFKLHGQWGRLQIADKNNPWHNLIETGRASFDVEVRPLFWRKFIIREMALENVRSGTRRSRDGSLPLKITVPSDESSLVERTKIALERQFGEIPIFDLSGMGKKLNLDSLVQADQLASVQGYRQLKLFTDSSYTFWQSQLKPGDYAVKADDIEKKIKSLKIDEIKDLAGLTSTLKIVNEIHQDVANLRNEVNEKYGGVTVTYERMQAEFAAMKDSLQGDIKRAQQLAKLQSLDMKNISMLLFGKPALQGVERIVGYISQVRHYLPTAQKVMGAQRVKKPSRFKGQDIHFPFHYRYPKFLIRTAKLSAATAAGDTSSAYFIDGTLSGLTNQPLVYNDPTKFKLEFEKLSGNQYLLQGSLDHTTEQAKDSLWIHANNFGLGKIKLKQSKYFPEAVEAKKGNLTLSGFFIGDAIDLKLNLNTAPVNFIFENEAEGRLERIFRDVLSGINNVTLNAALTGEASDYRMRMNSNVDRLLSDQLSKTLDKTLREAQMEVENYVRNAADKYRKEAESVFDKYKVSLQEQMATVHDKVMIQSTEIENKKKELEARIEKEKNKLKNKGKKTIQDFIKKS